MKQKKYDVNYFINKFSKIPEKRWITDTFVGVNPLNRCARGFCLTAKSAFKAWRGKDAVEVLREYNEELVALDGLFGQVSEGIVIALINNGWVKEYQQATPKQRVLAALQDLKLEQESAELMSEVKDIIQHGKVHHPAT